MVEKTIPSLRENTRIAETALLAQITRIEEHLRAAGELREDEKLVIKIGPEIEFTDVAGEEAYRARLTELVQATGSTLTQKHESYMPLFSTRKATQKWFRDGNWKGKAPGETLNEKGEWEEYEGRGSTVIRVDLEPSGLRDNTIRRGVLSPEGAITEPALEAANQKELVAPPFHPLGVARWFNKILPLFDEFAPERGLKRSFVGSQYSPETEYNGLHLNISLIAVNTQTQKSRNVLEGTGPADENGVKPLSPFAFAVAESINTGLKEMFLLYAPVNRCWQRFSSGLCTPTFIGFTPHKLAEGGSAIFRGGGRRGERPENPLGGPDMNTLRVELRLPCVESLGHPDKKMHPDQKEIPFALIEGTLSMFARAAEHVAHPEKNILHPPATEEELYTSNSPLPRSHGAAKSAFKHSAFAQETFGKDRVQKLMELYNEFEKLAPANPSRGLS